VTVVASGSQRTVDVGSREQQYFARSRAAQHGYGVLSFAGGEMAKPTLLLAAGVPEGADAALLRRGTALAAPVGSAGSSAGDLRAAGRPEAAPCTWMAAGPDVGPDRLERRRVPERGCW